MSLSFYGLRQISSAILFAMICPSLIVRTSLLFHLQQRFCNINGECFEDSQRNPANPCQICRPKFDQYDWSTKKGHSTISVHFFQFLFSLLLIACKLTHSQASLPHGFKALSSRFYSNGMKFHV